MRISLLSETTETTENPLTCSACKKLIPSPFGAIEGAPAILGCSQNPSIEQDKLLDFHIYVCPFCGLIQTDTRLDSESYETVHSHAAGGIWAEYGNKLAEFISECLGNRLGKLENALEIGPSVSPILKKLPQAIPFIKYVDLMNEVPFELTPNEHYEKLPFPSTRLDGKFDLIVASHVLEHAESLYVFMEAVKRHLKVRGIAILSTPNFREWLTKKYWNAITSEHLNYPFVEHLKNLCTRLGLTVKFAYFKLHSVFLQISLLPEGRFPSKSHQERSRKNTWQILEDWIIEINLNIAKYETSIGDTAQEVILAGASHLSQYVVLISERIRSRARYVLDNVSDKHGKRLYGTKLIGQPFDIVKQFQSPVVIVPPSPYLDEMIRQIINLNPNASVIS